MNIVLTFDNSYVQHASALIASICVNNEPLITFFIISDYISSTNQKLLENMILSYNNQVTFLSLDKKVLEDFPIGEGTANTYVSLATYYRLFIPELIPQNVTRVIYLDCDVIVDGSLTNLWNIDLGDKCIAALQEQSILCRAGCERLNYPLNDLYFNAGVLVLNLDKIREKYSSKDYILYIKGHYREILFHDQDVLNKFFHTSKMFFPLRYNVMDSFLRKHAKLPSYYEYNINEIFEPIVIHYSGPIKPWHKECKNPYSDLYFKYLQLTPWKNSKSLKKYSTFKDIAIFRLKGLAKFILELLHIRYYSYITLKI